MAKVPAPKRGTKGAPPTALELTRNLDITDNGEMAPLNFKVAPAFRIEFKTYASRMGISMKELLERCFHDYRQSHPQD